MTLITNESNLDKNIRKVAGTILVVIAITLLTGATQMVAAVVGFVALATGFTGFCPLYKLLGIKTSK